VEVVLVMSGCVICYFIGRFSQRVEDRHRRGEDWKGDHRGYMR
jgi:hypothetical protein